MHRTFRLAFLAMTVLALAILCHHGGWGHMSDTPDAIGKCPLCSTIHATDFGPPVVFALLALILIFITGLSSMPAPPVLFGQHLAGNPFRAPPAV